MTVILLMRERHGEQVSSIARLCWFYIKHMTRVLTRVMHKASNDLNWMQCTVYTLSLSLK